jgi:DNA-binding MarR family transcriptional regulator
MDKNAVISEIAKINRSAKRVITEELVGRGIEGIAPSHGDILMLLYRKGSMILSELARRIHREKNTTTVLVRKLKDHGYVECTKSTEDRRKTIVTLTEKGMAMKETFNGVSEILVRKTWQGFSEEEKYILLSMLARVRSNLEEENQE